MAETLGSLCDKLTIVKLKQWHSDDAAKQASLAGQEQRLRDEVDEFVAAAVAGRVPVERLTFAANKVYRAEGNKVSEIKGDIGEVVARLAEINCELWHEVEKGYEIEDLPNEAKNGIVKRLAVLNLDRNQCIDRIDQQFRSMIERPQVLARES